MKLYFVINLQKENAVGCARQAVDLLEQEGAQCYICSELEDQLQGNGFRFAGPKQQLSEFDMIIAVGGDGTIMDIGKQAALQDIPVLGINAGRLGFMAGVEMCDLSPLKQLMTGQYTEQHRMMLEMNHYTAQGVQTYAAVNDLLITKDTLTNIIDIDVYCGDRIVNEYRADSVLFSTPTGSTAYSLSNGGPIADPTLSYVSVSPICPHSFASRTYLFHEETVLSARWGKNNRNEVFLVADGKVIAPLKQEEKIEIRASKHRMRLVVLKNHPFYEVVGKKFIVN